MIQQGSSVQQEAVLDEVVVGKGCRIGKNCRLKYCVLMDGVQLGDGCVLSDCVLDSGCVLDAGCTLAHCVVGRGVRLGEFFTATGRLVHKWARRGRVRRSEPPVEDEALAALWRYRAVAVKQFGGVTGDLAGWFLQRAELWMLAALLLSGRWLG